MVFLRSVKRENTGSQQKRFPIMNLKTDILDGTPSERDSIRDIVRDARKLDPVLGQMVAYSDGSLERGFNPDLVRRKGCFKISRDDTPRFHWGDEEDYLNSLPYRIKSNGQIFYKPGFSMFERPVFNLGGLYRNHGIKDRVGVFRPQDNVDGKTRFLEDFLDMRDKSGYRPKDMLAKNPKLRLKLLEANYDRNAELYAQR